MIEASMAVAGNGDAFPLIMIIVFIILGGILMSRFAPPLD